MDEMNWQQRIDRLWAENIGSRHLTVQDELRVINRLLRDKSLSRDSIYELYLSSKFWKRLRLKVLARDKYQCVKCKSRVNLQIDHIRYSKYGSEKLSDLQTLCYVCHDDKTEKADLNHSGRFFSDVKGAPLFTVMRRFNNGG
jgi:HNH endonuclease